MSQRMVVRVDTSNGGTIENLIEELQEMLERIPKGVDHWVELEDSTDTVETSLIVGYLLPPTEEEAQIEREYKLSHLALLEKKCRELKEELDL